MFTLQEMADVLGRTPRDVELHVFASIEDWYVLQNKTGYAVCVLYGRQVTLRCWEIYPEHSNRIPRGCLCEFNAL